MKDKAPVIDYSLTTPGQQICALGHVVLFLSFPRLINSSIQDMQMGQESSLATHKCLAPMALI
jgi:hypothetical protein